MEKVYLKPTAHEITLRGHNQDGYADAFAYDPNGHDESPKLGHLFIVGQVKHENNDVAYMLSLIAALAKREYYANPGRPPKEAFAETLKKINEVVEEFFKNQGLSINVGLCALAGEQIYISRLGKFKILLVRGGKTIDILNNIQLFEKEHIQNKEFSNIISGKINDGDRILAFYPGQPVVSRERYVKSYFSKLPENDFVAKLAKIKSANDSFSCAMLSIRIDTVRESAAARNIQPPELKAVLAEQPVRPSEPEKPAVPVEKTANTVASHTNLPVPPVQQPLTAAKAEIPRIIPTEFSLGRRNTIFSSISRQLKFFHVNLTPKVKILMALAGTMLVISLALAAKSLFITDPATKRLQETISAIQTKISDAQTQIQAHNAQDARQTIKQALGLLSDIANPNAKKPAELHAQLLSLLDNIDQTVNASPVLVAQLPDNGSQARLVSVFDDTALIYSKDNSSNVQYLYDLEQGALKNTITLHTDINPSILANSDGTALLIDVLNGKVILVSQDTQKEITLKSATSLTDAKVYQGNLYVLADNTIGRIADIVKGNGTAKAWLKPEEKFPAESFALAVDGNIFTLSKSGVLTTYFKGGQVAQVQTQVSPSDDGQIMTTSDSLYLYVTDRKTNRIAVLDKKTGDLVKTYKIDSALPILGADVSANDTLYFITQDNKIWKIK